MMRNQNVKLLALAVVTSTAFIACNPLKNMVKRQAEVNFKVTPNPVEMHGDSIEIVFTGSFPTKYFNKKVSATVTPTMNYGDNSQAFEPIKLKGEASEAEGQVIKYEAGGSFTHTTKIAYKEGMDVATVDLKVQGAYKTKTSDLEPREGAIGTIITPKLVMSSDKAIMGNDKFEKFTLENNLVEINYLVNNSSVRGSEMYDADVKDLTKKIKAWSKDSKMEFNGLDINAYASPEGELSKNDNLANERAASASKSIISLLKRAKVDVVTEDWANLKGKGEDWVGFKDLMNKSDIEDKALILRVLEQYSDLNKREEEIKNLAATYTQVAKKILPKLRRSKANLVMKHYDLSDEEIKTLVDTKIDSLNVEQMLYAATLYDDDAKKEMIYKSVSSIHSSDWRGANNLGYLYVSQNKLAEAKTQFEKANGISEDNPVINNNLGVIERLNGNLDAAMAYYDKASGAGSEVAQNKGIINIIKGDYTSATSNYSGVNSFNAALANLLGGNNSVGAMIDASEDKEEALSYYLKAISGARTSNSDMVMNNLKAAIAKDASLKGKAKTDAEFIKFREDAEFQEAVN